jgi:hypothetical protein
MNITIDDKLHVKNNNESLIIKTPIIRIPFGLEKEYNNMVVKLELPKDKVFSKLIEALEKKFCEILDIPYINSQLRLSTNERYGDLLLTKIIRYKDRAQIKVDRGNKMEYIGNLKKGDKGIATLEIDTIWKYEDKYTYKIKLKELALL